jgi:hypothetical protein
MPVLISDSHLARELIRIGDEAIGTEDDSKAPRLRQEGVRFPRTGHQRGLR